MICQLRLFGLVWELLWANGFLIGFTLPGFGVRAGGVNLGPFALCIWRDTETATCGQCGRTLKGGLHGDLFGLPLCKRKAFTMGYMVCRQDRCWEAVTDYDAGLCEFHALQRRLRT